MTAMNDTIPTMTLSPQAGFLLTKIAIQDGAVLEGEIPPRQLRMVQVWMDIHREDLMLDWDLAVSGEPPFRIAPLH